MTVRRRDALGIIGATATGAIGYQVVTGRGPPVDSGRWSGDPEPSTTPGEGALERLRNRASSRAERLRSETGAIAELSRELDGNRERMVTADRENDHTRLHRLKQRRTLLLYRRGHVQYELGHSDWTAGTGRWRERDWRRSALAFFRARYLFERTYEDWHRAEASLSLETGRESCTAHIGESMDHAGEMRSAAGALANAAYYYATDQPGLGEQFKREGNRAYGNARATSVRGPETVRSCFGTEE